MGSNRRAPTYSWLIMVLFFISLAAWSVSSPVGSSPDDDVHIAALYCGAGKSDCSLPVERPFPCFARDSRITGDCESRADDRRPITGQFAVDDYPGLYQKVMSGFLGDTVGRSTANIRLLNCLLAVALLAVSFMTARREHRAAVLMCWFSVALPLTMFTVASINPNSWTITGIAALWAPLLALLLDDTMHWGRLAVVLLAALMVVGSRTEGVVLLGIVVAAVAAYGFAGARRRRSLVVLTVLIPVGGLVMAQTAHELAGRSAGRPIWQTLVMGASAPFESLGGGHYFPAQLGWLDTPLPPIVSAIGICVFAGVTFVGWGRMGRPKAVALLTFWLLLFGAATFAWIVKYPIPLQPRYFLPLMAVAVGLALLPTSGQGPPVFAPAQLALVVVTLGAANALGLLYLSLRFVVGVPGESTIVPGPYYPGPADLLSAGVPQWWQGYFAPFGNWLLGSLAFVTAGVLLARYIWHTAPDVHESEPCDA